MMHNLYLSECQVAYKSDTFETVGSFCCIAGTVTASIRLEKKGFALRDAIPVYAEIKNLSTRRISHTHVSLIQDTGMASRKANPFFSSLIEAVTVPAIQQKDPTVSNVSFSTGYCNKKKIFH
jgi:hypothetical protein